MTLALLRFHRDTQHENSVNWNLMMLAGTARTTLHRLDGGAVYTSPFCRSFHAYYGPLRKL